MEPTIEVAGNSISVSLNDWLIAAGIIIFFLLMSVIIRFFFGKIVLIFTHRTKTSLDDLILKALVTPLVLAVTVLGVYLAIIRLPLDAYSGIYHKVFVVIVIILATWTVVRLGNAVVTWYGREVAHRTNTNFDDRLLQVMQRVGSIVVWGLGLLLILDQTDIDISPLIASMGIGGLAIAIAVQPVLSNFMAGTYVISDSVIRKGHYIVLDTGQEGYVEDIGWRTTKIRHWQGNAIILPNSKLAEAIVTDSEAMELTKVFKVDCGVGYHSDLDKVERVSLEVGKEVMIRSTAGVNDFEPLVRFKEFGDSNIIFSVVLKSIDRMSQFQLKHEFIKALHKRFNEENITIEFPIRRLYYSPDNPKISGESPLKEPEA